MRAAFHETEGGLEVLQYGEVPDPEPGPNDLLVRVHATSMDRLDVFTREGSHGQGVVGDRYIGGRDFAGVVEASGARSGASRWGSGSSARPRRRTPSWRSHPQRARS